MRLFTKIKDIFTQKENVKASPPVKDIFIGIFVGLVMALLAVFGSLQKFEYLTLDSFFRIRGERAADEDIVIVGIDDKSLEVLGRWPWPRGYHATFLQIVDEHAPRFIAFDILFPEADPQGDEALAMVTRETGNVYLATYFTFEDDAAIDMPEKDIDLAPLPYIPAEIQRYDFLSASEITLPVEPLRDAAKRVCAINAPPDSDGSTRHLPLVIKFRGKLYPTLSLQLACDYLNVEARDLIIKPGLIIIPLKEEDDIRIPIDSAGRMLLNYNGPIRTFKMYSYIQLLHDYNKSLKEGARSLVEDLRGKVVFVGQVATGTVDLRIMPFSNLYPAVGGHATALNNILSRNMLRSAPLAYNVAIIILASALLSFLIKRGRKMHVNLAVMVLLFLICAASSYIAFVFLHLYVYTFAPLIAILLTYAAVSVNHYEAVRHEKKILENELLIARTIQQSFLPKSYPKVPFLEFAAQCNPAKQIGGDLYDFVQLGDDKIGILIGDVSGKGVPAALYMARAVSEFRAKSHLAGDAASTLGMVNDSFASEGMEKSFITMQYLTVDLKEKRLFFSNGGHNTILHFVKSAGKIEELDTKQGMPIGILEGAEFENREIRFEQGDILFLYSDGISEAMNKKRKEFGIENVKDILIENRSSKSGEILLKVLEAIAKFSKGAPQHDDMTAIVIKSV